MIHSSRILRGRKVRVDVTRLTVATVDFERVATPAPGLTSYGHSQPLTETESRTLKEGEATTDFRVWITSDTLQANDDKAGKTGDLIENHLGFQWRIMRQKMWGAGNRHNRYIMQKIREVAA